MKIFDPKRHLPPGWDHEALDSNLRWYHGLSALSLISFLSRFSQARSELYVYVEQPGGEYLPELVTTRTITPFRELMAGLPYLGMWCFLALMALQVWRYYAHHTRESMSVYTMRRLPDPWEYHRRCWAQPILSTLFELLLFALLTGLCWLFWYYGTPVPCRPF